MCDVFCDMIYVALLSNHAYRMLIWLPIRWYARFTFGFGCFSRQVARDQLAGPSYADLLNYF